MNKHTNKFTFGWKILVMSSVIATVVLFLIEVTIHLNHTMEYVFHELHILALIVLGLDIAYLFYKANNKKKFLMKNALIIISLFPLASIFRYLGESAKLAGFMKISRLGAKVGEFGVLARGVEAGLESFRPIIKSAKLYSHFVEAESIHVNVYVEPGCDKPTVDGIIKGIGIFTHKYSKSKIITTKRLFSDFYNYQHFTDPVLHGDKLIDHAKNFRQQVDEDQDFIWNVVITSRHTEFDSDKHIFAKTKIMDDTIVSVYNTKHIHHHPLSERMEKAMLIGYHSLSELLQKADCCTHHCVFNLKSEKDLNTAYYFYKKFGEIPQCNHHLVPVF